MDEAIDGASSRLIEKSPIYSGLRASREFYFIANNLNSNIVDIPESEKCLPLHFLFLFSSISFLPGFQYLLPDHTVPQNQSLKPRHLLCFKHSPVFRISISFEMDNFNSTSMVSAFVKATSEGPAAANTSTSHPHIPGPGGHSVHNPMIVVYILIVAM